MRVNKFQNNQFFRETYYIIVRVKFIYDRQCSMESKRVVQIFSISFDLGVVIVHKQKYFTTNVVIKDSTSGVRLTRTLQLHGSPYFLVIVHTNNDKKIILLMTGFITVHHLYKEDCTKIAQTWDVEEILHTNTAQHDCS